MQMADIPITLILLAFVAGVVGVIVGIYAISEGVALGKMKYDERKKKGEYD